MKIETSFVSASHLKIENSTWFDQYNRSDTVYIPRENFLNIVCQTLAQYNYVGPKQREDVALACRFNYFSFSIQFLLMFVVCR